LGYGVSGVAALGRCRHFCPGSAASSNPYRLADICGCSRRHFCSAAAGDFNGDGTGDGKAELVTTALFEGAISVLRNTTATAGDILRALKITGMTKLTNGHIMLAGQGRPSQKLQIEGSQDRNAANFIPIGSVMTEAAGKFECEDDPRTSSHRSYRLTMP
jgi:hypothetical protein